MAKLFSAIVVARRLILIVCCWFSFASQIQADTEREQMIPDIPDYWAQAVRYQDENFSMAFVFAGLLDYTIFDQDRQSIEQVGEQENTFERRSLRLIAAGTLDAIGPWSYLLAAEYKGFAREPEDPLFNFTDVSLSRHFAGESGRLTLGKQKQTFVYEMIGDAANLIHHERLLEPFFAARSWGVSYTGTFIDKKIGIQLGWYNNWFVEGGDFAGEGNQFTARLTGLPIWRDDGGQLLHIGVSARYQEDHNSILRFRGRPGSHATTPYVDTGDFDADFSLNLGLEALWQGYKLTVLGEYVRAFVSAPKLGNPQFDGYYITVSYLFNGGLRPYDALTRFNRRVIAGRGWGAFEPFVRFGHVDLDDALISGGSMKKWYAGLNWWATRRWKMSVGYGDIELDRFNITGDTRQVLFRLQWIGP